MVDENMVIRILKKEDRKQIHPAFIIAFKDYYHDMGYLTEERLLNRMEKNGFRYDVSAGMFRDNNMVGFVFTGSGIFNGVKAAHDTGTGIVKEFRSMGYSSFMFDKVKVELLKKDYRLFVLEVLQENEHAINAYKRAGFQISRELLCYQLTKQEAEFNSVIDMDIQPGDRSILKEFEESVNCSLSWETSFDAIHRIPDQIDIYVAKAGNINCGVLVYYPGLRWIVTLIVKKNYRRKGIGTALLKKLFDKLPESSESIKVINIDGNDKDTMAFVKNSGFKDYAEQYEMILDLGGGK